MIGLGFGRRLKSLIKNNTRFKAEFNGDKGYEVINLSNKDDKYIVKMKRVQCTYKKWEFN